jgi:Protein of unknown function (DUF3016)
MSRALIHGALSLALAGLATAAAAAGTVEVSFVEPARFSDAGVGEVEITRTAKALTDHLQGFASRLPDSQRLRVEVLDVDRAGEVPLPGSTRRVMRGRGDSPSIQLRYALLAEGRTLISGQERLTDLDYLSSNATKQVSGDFAYELRLLDEWFAERIAAP